MAIKKESAQLSAGRDKLRNKKNEGLIRARHDLKDKKRQKDYEAGIDPQDEQFNTMPEGEGAFRGNTRPGSGNRLHSDNAGLKGDGHAKK